MKSGKIKNTLAKFVRSAHGFLTMPMAIFFLTYSHKVHPGYNMSWGKRIRLGFRFWRNNHHVTSGTSWRAHLVIAMKLLEIPPEVPGDVVECGCWKGGASVNISIICEMIGRKMRIYDSFEGLPPAVEGDVIAEKTFKQGFIPGIFGGTLDEVTDNVRRYGAIDVVSFHKGWFEDTLPHHEGDIALMFLDVDFYSSLHDCLLNLWPSVVDGGFVFLDEYLNLPYCAVFYSEKYWDKYFSSAPPGLVGAGTGVQVGMHYTDPSIRFQRNQMQGAESISYCIKGNSALWDFYPDENEDAGENASAAAEQPASDS